jgi:hypothetical protein
MTFHILGMSSSQLTNSYFQRGGSTTNQYRINDINGYPNQSQLQKYIEFLLNMNSITASSKKNLGNPEFDCNKKPKSAF